jgi:thiol-disulfide isomerase/thioredoxin
VVGRLYPYGPFYEKGTCRDTEDKLTGKPDKTGALAGCRTPEGVYDLSGNVYEWIGATAEESAMMGGDFRTKTSGTCRRRAATYGAGYKNETIGFRCCAEAQIKDVATASDVRATGITEIVGKGIPADLALELRGGGTLDPKLFKGKVTYLTFFASWCGNCRKQMPAIMAWEDDWKKKGFQVVGINVDRKLDRGEKYIKELEPNFKIAYDPSARTMTDFDINAMPTSFIVDRDGKIVRRIVGYKDAEIAATKKAITDLL